MEKELIKQLALVLLDNEIDVLNEEEIQKKYPLINSKGYWKTWIFDLLKLLNKLKYFESHKFTQKVLLNTNKEDVIDEWTLKYLGDLLN
jgi:hypothetical protein